jgi:hypothetical protein
MCDSYLKTSNLIWLVDFDATGIHVFAHKLKEWTRNNIHGITRYVLEENTNVSTNRKFKRPAILHSLLCETSQIVQIEPFYKKEEAKQFAKDIGAVDYVETSCVTFENMQVLYQKIIW